MDTTNLKATRQSFGEELERLGRENENIVVLNADLSGSTKTSIFEKSFPDRFFNMGIAEQDMISTAAGLAAMGKIPYASTFAVFATGRAYDQIRSSVAYPKLDVKICASHSGITVGEDGATHQMLEDLGIMRGMPNIKVLCASDDIQTKWAVREIAKVKGPVYLRLSKSKVPQIYDENTKFEIGKGIQIGDGTRATVFSTGGMVNIAIEAMEELKEQGIDIRVVDMHTIKPIDRELIVKCSKETDKLISIEDHSIINGLGTAIMEVLSEENPKKLTRIGINDEFGKSGKTKELLQHFGLTKENIISKIIE